jgi:hypothetical protein
MENSKIVFQMLLRMSDQEKKRSGACGMWERQEKYIPDFGGVTRSKKSAWKT